MLCMLTGVAHGADRIEIPSSFNPVGSGARAMGLGGSFIAMADDATAASWNPAALLKLRQAEFALAYANTYRVEDDVFTEAPEANGKQTANDFDLNYLAFSVPCVTDKCGKNMIFSLNYQRLYELSRSRQWQQHIKDRSVDLQRDSDYRQSGALYALGAAYAVQLTPDFFVGITLNFWQDFLQKNEWQQDYFTVDVGLQVGLETTEVETYNTHYQFKGFNYNLGLLWELFEQKEQKLTLGLVYKSGFTADLTKTRYYSVILTVPERSDLNSDIEWGPDTSQQKLDMPRSIGVGMAYQWSDNLTTSIDFYRTWWSDFLLTDSNGTKLSPLDSRPAANTTISNTTQIRMGAEYRLISQQYGRNYIIPFRAGVFIDPVATGLGQENTYGFAVGSGI
ncbi:MAG: outer membrane protein transport protein, partial [Psychrosphaera sp.]|nr:outer membrane protein transport protein [Psychrosphaera sp.]